MTEDNFEKKRQKALQACQASINWFAKHKKTPRNLYFVSQVATIALSALTPVLILMTDLSKWKQALPAALAAVSAGLNNVFNWKDHWVRRASTLEFLIAEKLKYETRTSPIYDLKLDDQQALNNFVEKVTSLNLMEVSNWEKAQSKRVEKDT